MAPARVVAIGGATLDRTYRLAAPLVPGTSNPATGRRGFGGVARNVAETLARLGIATALVSRVGDDPDGLALVEALAAVGVASRGVETVPGAATAAYVAVLTPAGDLALGLADMAVLDGLGPAALAARADLLREAEWVFADCNLPAAALAWLAARGIGAARYRLAVDAVSVAKSARLPRRLDGIDLLFLNRDEAAALVGPRDPVGTAEALHAAGAGSVVLTLGAAGALAASPAGAVSIPAVAAEIVDVTGAGDALIAATLAGLIAGRGLAEAVGSGCRAAAHTLGRPEAVSPVLGVALGVPPFGRRSAPEPRPDPGPNSPASPAINQNGPQ